MANETINDLSAIAAVASDDVFAMWDTSIGATRKGSTTQVIAALPAATGSIAGTMSASDKQLIDGATSAATGSALVLRGPSGDAAFTVLTAGQVTVTGTPTAATDATNKSYVDSVAAGLTIKAAAVAATTTNVTLAGGAPSTLDGVTLALNNRILVKDQSVGTQNGIYYVSTLGSGSNGTWTRATDADTGAEMPTGTYIFISGGTVNASTSWVMNTTGAITIGVSTIVWVLFSQIANVPAANITGTIVASQIAAAAITTAKFAAGITPVEIVATIPVSGNFEGRTVYLTTVDGSFPADKLYRWTDSSTTGNTFWTSSVPAVDVTGTLTNSQIADLAAAKLTGQITTTQITDTAITTAKIFAGAITTAKIAASAVTATEIASDAVTAVKIFAGSVTTAKIAAGAVTANELFANSVIAGKIAAGAVSTTELATGAVTATKISAGTITATEIAALTITAAKIATGTITADKLSVSTLSAITANIGTVTAGSITSNSTISLTGGNQDVTISKSSFSIANASASFVVNGQAGLGMTTQLGDLAGANYIKQYSVSGTTLLDIVGPSSALIRMQTNGTISQTGTLTTAGILSTGNNGAYTAPMTAYGGNVISFSYAGSNTLRIKIDSTVFTVALTP